MWLKRGVRALWDYRMYLHSAGGTTVWGWMTWWMPIHEFTCFTRTSMVWRKCICLVDDYLISEAAGVLSFLILFGFVVRLQMWCSCSRLDQRKLHMVPNTFATNCVHFFCSRWGGNPNHTTKSPEKRGRVHRSDLRHWDCSCLLGVMVCDDGQELSYAFYFWQRTKCIP